MAKKRKDQNATMSRNRRWIYAVAVTIIAAIPIVYLYSISLSPSSQPRAAIIDQLGSSRLSEAIRHENQTFIETAKELLYKRFSVVDYFSDNATVEQYGQLASAGYRLIVWRAHTALDLGSKYVAISTTDKYGSKDYDEYLENYQLTLCNITGDPTLYFGVTPKFIEQTMSGRFQDTVIMLLSCNGLQPEYLKTAQAFEQKGVKVFMSWDGWVNSFDNDHAASLLLQYLINDNNTMSMAISKIPAYSSEFGWTQLRYDPQSGEAAEYRIPDYRQKESIKGAALVASTMQRKTRKR